MLFYKTIVPETNSAEYSDGDLITFVIPIDPDQELDQGSIFVSGNLEVMSGANVLTAANGVQYDSQAGVHSFIDSVVCSVNTGAGDMILENIQNYNRYAKMFYEANQHYITQAFKNSSTQELRCGQDSYTSYVLQGTRNDANGANTGLNSFSFMPLICVNRTSQNIQSSKVKFIKIQLTLSTSALTLYNPNNVANLTFKWKDVKCHYTCSPISQETKPLNFVKIISAKTNIQSSEVNLTYQPPANVIAVSMTFNKKNNTDVANKTKYLQTDQLPNVQRVEFTVAGYDYTLKFPLKDENEIVLNYIKSLNPRMLESNAIYANLLGYGYGIGLNYLSAINFLNSKMSINIQSAITESDLYTTYIYFTCEDSL